MTGRNESDIREQARLKRMAQKVQKYRINIEGNA
jgi:hypothetical protein